MSLCCARPQGRLRILHITVTAIARHRANGGILSESRIRLNGIPFCDMMRYDHCRVTSALVAQILTRRTPGEVILAADLPP